MLNFRQYIEQFHLLFLDQLGRKLDKRLYALKGGCNLRFYFKSIRYSEDVDLDIQIIRKDTLLKNLQKIFESKPFQQILQTRNITIENISLPKQTGTTQRWKIALKAANLPGLHTKIEFSQRGFKGNTLFESIDPNITRAYNLSPILFNHYDRITACEQKIRALADRNITQARDIFDLYILLGEDKKALKSKNKSQDMVAKALENLKGISYQNFLSQVVAYLQQEYQPQYKDKSVWQHIVNKAQQYLEELL